MNDSKIPNSVYIRGRDGLGNDFAKWMPGSGISPTGNTLTVDNVYGNDAAAARESGAFKTLTAAKAAAISGDTIIVYPGTYNEYDLAKTGVNWHFMTGATVTKTSTADTTAIFDDNGVATTIVVTGFGVFSTTSAAASSAIKMTAASTFSVTCRKITGVTATPLINVSDDAHTSTSILNVYADSIEQTILTSGNAIQVSQSPGLVYVNIYAGKITSANTCISCTDAYVLIDCPEITGGAVAASFAGGDMELHSKRIQGTGAIINVLTGSGRLLIQGCTIKNQGAPTNIPVLIAAASTALILKSSTVIAGASAAASISGGAASSMLVYGGCEANILVATTTQLVGTITISANVT